MDKTLFLILLVFSSTSAYTSPGVDKDLDNIYKDMLEKFETSLETLKEEAHFQEETLIRKRDVSEGGQQPESGSTEPMDGEPLGSETNSSTSTTLCDDLSNWDVAWNNSTSKDGKFFYNLRMNTAKTDECFGDLKYLIFFTNSTTKVLQNGYLQTSLILMKRNGTLTHDSIILHLTLNWGARKCFTDCKSETDHYFMGSVHYETRSSNLSRIDTSWSNVWNGESNATKISSFHISSLYGDAGGNITERWSFSGSWSPTHNSTVNTGYTPEKGFWSQTSSWNKAGQIRGLAFAGGMGANNVPMGEYGGPGIRPPLWSSGTTQSQGPWGYAGPNGAFGTSQTYGAWGHQGTSNTYHAQGNWGYTGASGTWGSSGNHGSGNSYQTQGNWGNSGTHDTPDIMHTHSSTSGSEIHMTSQKTRHGRPTGRSGGRGRRG